MHCGGIHFKGGCKSSSIRYPGSPTSLTQTLQILCELCSGGLHDIKFPLSYHLFEIQVSSVPMDYIWIRTLLQLWERVTSWVLRKFKSCVRDCCLDSNALFDYFRDAPHESWLRNIYPTSVLSVLSEFNWGQAKRYADLTIPYPSASWSVWKIGYANPCKICCHLMDYE